MNEIKTLRGNQIIKSILLLAGSFTFAFLWGEFVHDSGHYLSHLAYGNTQVQVHFDPFGGTHIIGANGLPDRALAVTSAAGPLPHLALALVTFALLWRVRRPMLMPLLLWGPVALIQEGVTFSLGLLTPGGDARWIATLGIPPFILLINGITFLMTGLGLVSVLLPMVGLKRDDTFRYKLLVLFAGMCSLMLIRSIHSVLIATTGILENLIPLIFSLLLAICAAAIHTPISKMMDMRYKQNSSRISRIAPSLALIMGAGMFVLQLIQL